MKQIVILGAGESGTGAALLAHAKGYQVFVSDSGTIDSVYKQQLEAQHIPFEEKQHTWQKIKDTHEIIKSPGIPNTTPIMQAIHKAGIPVIDEIAFATRYTKATLIAITGSNGKTTVTQYIYHVLQQAGLDIGIAGNMGTSFAKKLFQQEDHAYYVLELSSFQLEYIHHCRFHIACLLNITPDHLDRYDYRMDKYIAAKQNIGYNMTPQDWLIYNADDKHVAQGISSLSDPNHPKTCPISLKGPVHDGAYLKASCIYFHGTESYFKLSLETLPLHGKHNIFNAMVVGLVATYLKVPSASIIKGLQTFKGLPHRMELIADCNSIKFYNDSKATNVAATMAALQSFDQPIVWIAGGYDKGNDYTPLQAIVHKWVKALIVLGTDNTPIKQAFADCDIPMYETTSIEEAVAIAYNLALPQHIILLSPACASFDLFQNFEDRGQQFKDAVNALVCIFKRSSTFQK